MPQGRGGFSIIELMIAATLSTIVLAGVLTTFLMIARSGIRATNYSMMESETRRGFEQLGVDARMASDFSATFTSGAITAFTLTIPDSTLSSTRQVTYGYDQTSSTNPYVYYVPGSDPTITTGRVVLINHVTNLTFLRYNTTGALIPASTTSSAGIKHIQISVSVTRAGMGVAAATQIIRSSAFTLRNISI